MFKPYEIIFVPTQQCNLHCSHCFVPNNPQKLDITVAKNFLNSSLENGIDRIGFSGGEPFLAPDFLNEITAFTVEKSMYFDRIMTNGTWFSSKEHLESVLSDFYDAGFDGTICISYDIFHNQDPQKIKLFVESIFTIWKDRRVLELSAVKSINPNETNQTIQMIKSIAQLLEAKVNYTKDNLPISITFTQPLKNAYIYYEDEKDRIRINWIDQTGAVPNDPLYWQSNTWFTEDFCEGPGQVLYIHADGSIAPCCGYANDKKALIIGNIYEMSISQVLSNAKTLDFIQTVYGKGLLEKAKEMEKNNYQFPGKGKTNNNCQFCSFLQSCNILK